VPTGPRLDGAPAPVDPRTVVIDKDTEQVHIILGGAGVSRTDGRRFALGVLNAALGGGMSSRLFQEIREKRGLAYSVYSYTAQYADSGIFGVYAGCQPAKAEEVLSICRDEVAKAAAESLTEEELDRGKGQLRGAMVLGLEDTGSRMSRIGKSELVYESLLPVDEVLARIEAVTLDDVRAVAGEVLTAPQALTVIGPVGDGLRHGVVG
jgi:predicted Zn-dependent peptidase